MGFNDTYLFSSFLRGTLTAYGGSQAMVQLELQLMAYTRAAATQDPSSDYTTDHCNAVCLNLSKARNQTCIIMDTS